MAKQMQTLDELNQLLEQHETQMADIRKRIAKVRAVRAHKLQPKRPIRKAGAWFM
jgi:uncharacterized coiled-coil protein SlyX